jgi:HAD superfamily hydrolase (TIGR01490 family)
MNYYVFFDMDNTILDLNSAKLIIRQALKKKVIGKTAVLWAWVLIALYHLKWVKAAFVMKQLVKWVKNIEENKLVQFNDELFKKNVIKHIVPAAVDEILTHQKKGAKVVLLSAASEYTCYPLVKYLNLNGVICSKLETKNGILTGKFLNEPCYGKNKRIYLQQYAETRQINLKTAWYYADDDSDKPVFEIVGKAVCVNPSPLLEKEAQSKNWQIVNW